METREHPARAGTGNDRQLPAVEYKGVIPDSPPSGCSAGPVPQNGLIQERSMIPGLPAACQSDGRVAGSDTKSGRRGGRNSRRRENSGSDEERSVHAQRGASAKAGLASGPVVVFSELLEMTGLTPSFASATSFHSQEIGTADALLCLFTEVHRIDLGRLLNAPEFQQLCKLRKVPWTKATQANPAIAVFKICHPAITSKQASRYAAVTRQSHFEKIAPDDLSDHLKKNGGIDGCVKRFRDRIHPPGERSSFQPKLPKLVVSGVPALNDGEHTLRIRIVDGKASFRPDDGEDKSDGAGPEA